MFDSRFRVALMTAVVLCRALAAQEYPKQLSIRILEGNDVINYFNQRTAQEPVVVVEDENRKPVAGALVIFELPDHGPSGFFTNARRMLTVHTDADGKATANGLRANGTAGEFDISVTASSHGLVAKNWIRRVNQKPVKPTGHVRAIAIVAGVAVAAGVGAAVALGGGGKTPSNPGNPTPIPGTTVTAGPTTVGPPR
jgi:hypothetical protein